MLLGARQFFERRGAPTPSLPYDAEVEYLESTGTQWIDTGVKWDCAGDIKCLFAPMKVNGGVQACFGADDGFGAYNNNASLLAVNGSWGGYVNWSNSVSPGDEFLFDLAQHKIYKMSSGEYKTFTGSADAVSQSNITLCRYSSYRGSCRIYSFAATSQGTSIDIVPVRFTNELGQSEGAMYDRVSGQLFRNAGTGAFLYGPDKS